MARGRQIGTKVTPKALYALGTAEEINQRDKTGFQPSGRQFTQISPADSGGSLAQPRQGVKSGNLKFSDGKF